MKTNTFIIFFVFSIILLPVVSSALDWREEFEDICSMVMVSEELKTEELEKLIQRSEKLKPLIEASGDPAAKVYLMRLQKCRAMFEYIFELRTGKKYVPNQ